MDFFLNKLNGLLKKSNNSYSIIYFSDHGLSLKPNRVRHNKTVKNNYQVPFFIINSDDSAHRHIAQNYSNEHFLDLFASWIGVSTTKTNPQYDIFQLNNLPEDKEISVYYEDRMKNLDELQSEKTLD